MASTEGVLGRRSGENFTVASRLLPRESRCHLLAFYGYARMVDEMGDAYDGDRAAALEWAGAELSRALDDPNEPGLDPLIAGAARSIRAIGADPQPLVDLLEANRLDQLQNTWSTFDGLVHYCSLSANPVGRLVLAVLGVAGTDEQQWSDAICTGLQIVEHLQDVAEDARAGRIYIPLEDLELFGVEATELTSCPPARTELRALIAFEASRAGRFLDAGLPLIRALHGRTRWAVAGFVAGGRTAIDALASAHFDPLPGAPRSSKVRALLRTTALALS